MRIALTLFVTVCLAGIAQSASARGATVDHGSAETERCNEWIEGATGAHFMYCEHVVDDWHVTIAPSGNRHIRSEVTKQWWVYRDGILIRWATDSFSELTHWRGDTRQVVHRDHEFEEYFDDGVICWTQSRDVEFRLVNGQVLRDEIDYQFDPC